MKCQTRYRILEDLSLVANVWMSGTRLQVPPRSVQREAEPTCGTRTAQRGELCIVGSAFNTSPREVSLCLSDLEMALQADT